MECSPSAIDAVLVKQVSADADGPRDAASHPQLDAECDQQVTVVGPLLTTPGHVQLSPSVVNNRPTLLLVYRSSGLCDSQCSCREQLQTLQFFDANFLMEVQLFRGCTTFLKLQLVGNSRGIYAKNNLDSCSVLTAYHGL